MDHSVSGSLQPTEPFEGARDELSVGDLRVALEGAQLTITFPAADLKAQAIALGEDIARCYSVERDSAVSWYPTRYTHPVAEGLQGGIVSVGGRFQLVVDETVTPGTATLYRRRPTLPKRFLEQAAQDQNLDKAIHFADALTRTGSLHLAKNLLTALRDFTGGESQNHQDRRLAAIAAKPEEWVAAIGDSLNKQGHLARGAVPLLDAREIRRRLIELLRAIVGTAEGT